MDATKATGAVLLEQRPKNYQLLAQEEILGLKPCSPREPRPDSKQQLGQKRSKRSKASASTEWRRR
jgi:hypothetical protein